MNSKPTDWRAHVAEQNARLGIKSTPTRKIEPATTLLQIPPSKVEGRSQHKAGEMNGLEKKYAQHLYLRQMTNEITRYDFEAVKLRLAEHATFLTADFMVTLPDGAIEMHEVKGHWEDDARVKIKVAAKLFPMFQFVGVRWERREKDWKFETFRRG